ncbi:8-amino-7-oxononanoate synthase [Pelagibaculum spongiae]|uniref:8-amino-7-oxononanoate synthase n=2 Tax=Pelagibaculum spongiae TaxID=2080658 RepID=A0A2V1GNT4_9GAMM|nr:8-amino-7-oxononanoate synthase [Pelagibaculum spongiae]
MADTLNSTATDWQQQLQQQLSDRRDANLYRRRITVDGPQGRLLHVEGKQYLSFCNNDYLGLANHPKIKAAAAQAIETDGFGGGASHLVCGHNHWHHLAEQKLAQLTGRDRVLLFSTGYMANLGAINALVGRGDFIFQDKLNHASLIDGALLSQAKFQRYRHNDLPHLERLLEKTPDTGRKLIVSDGVFSMDGDLPRLPELAKLAQQHNAILMVDDAHGFGTIGATGGGIAEQCNLNQQQLPVLVGTLGKAFGCFGAFVAGSETVIETLIQQARSYIYTTSMPPSTAAAIAQSVDLVMEQSWRRDKLQQLIARFRSGAQQLGLQLMDSNTPIQPILLGDEATAIAASEKLKAAGLWVTAIRPPTVPKGTSRLRITFSADHSEADIDRLLSALEKI